MTVVGAILRYSHLEPTFHNSSHGQSPSTRPTSSLPAEDPTLFIVLPSHHIWAPHTRQRAVFSKSSRSRASTTVVVEHHCPKGCGGHPSYVDGIHVPLLRKVGDISRTERSRPRSWQHFSVRSSRIFSRHSKGLMQLGPQEVPEKPPSFTLLLDQSLVSSARKETKVSSREIYGDCNDKRREDGARTRSV